MTVSDFGNNAGLIVGPAIEDWRDRGFEDWPLRVAIEGRTVGEGRGRDMLDGPVGAVAFLLRLAAARGWPMPAGTLVSTGAVTGVHSIAIGERSVVQFGEAGSIACTIIAARPEAGTTGSSKGR